MTYKIFIQPQAEDDLTEIADYIALDSSQTAVQWLLKLRRKIDTLQTFPEALPRAREDASHRRDLFQLNYGNYRVIYFLDEEVVNVVSVRHSSRRPHSKGSLD